MSNDINCGGEQLALTDGSDPKPCSETSEDIIEYTIKYLAESYKTYKRITTYDILHNLFGLVIFKLFNSTYPDGIAKHTNKDRIPLLYTLLLFPREAYFVGVTQDYIDSHPVIKNLCDMCPNMCVSNNRYFGRDVVGLNNNPILVVDLPFTSIFIP
jgi:hypothetical protein